MTDSSPGVMRYILIFTAIYAAIMAFMNILLYGFDIDLGTGADVGMLFGAAYGTAAKFVKDNQRALEKRERRLLSLGSVMGSIIVSVVALFIVIPLVSGVGVMDEINQLISALSPLVGLAIIVVVCAFYYFLLGFIYGWGTKMIANKTVDKTATVSE